MKHRPPRANTKTYLHSWKCGTFHSLSNYCSTAAVSGVLWQRWREVKTAVELIACSERRLLHWSNIVGASHSRQYAIWQFGGYASRGVREVCELGYPRSLQDEIEQNVRCCCTQSSCHA